MSKQKLSGKALVVQLTDSELRVVKTTLGAALPQLQATYSAPLPEGAVVDGAIRSLESVRAALSTALELSEFKKTRKVVFALTTSQVVAETTTIPSVPSNRLAKMLEANFDAYFPIDTTNHHMTWQLVEKVGKELTIQMWAVPTVMVGPYYELANSLGLSVAAIDYSAHALASAAGVSYAAPVDKSKGGKKGLNMEIGLPKGKKKKAKGETPAEEVDLTESSAVAVEEQAAQADASAVELYLMAEPESLLMLFVQNGQVKMQRSFQCGYNMEAELSEVAMALDYFETVSGGSAEGSRCILCGSLADDDQFVMLANRVLNIPVHVLPALNASKWTLCVGAAKSDLDFGIADMNRPGAGGQINNAWQYGLILVAGVALAMMLVTTMGSKTLWNTTVSGLESTQQSLQIQAAQNANYAQNYYDYQSAYSKYSSDWETVFASLHTYNDNLSLVLTELEEILPDEVNVTAVNIADSGISLNMACEDKEKIAYTIMALRKLKYGQFAAMSSLIKPGFEAYPTPSTMYNTPTEAAPTVGSGYQSEEPAPTIGTGYGDLLGMLSGNPETLTLLNDLMESGVITEDVITKVISSGATTPEEIAAIVLESGAFSAEDVMNTLFTMSPEEFNTLEDTYAAVPDLGQDLNKLLAKATFNQRKNAMTTMLNNDPIAMYRFFNLFKVDMNRPGEEAVLHADVYAGVWENIDVLMLLFSGDMTNAEESIPVLVKLLVKNENCLSSTENLFREDPRLAERYALYLGMEMGELQIAGENLPKLDPEDIINDLKNGTIPPELEPILKKLLPPEIWELLFSKNNNNGGNDRPGRDDDDDDDDDRNDNQNNNNQNNNNQNNQNNQNNNTQNDAMQDLLNQLLNNQLNNPNAGLPNQNPGTPQAPQQPADERYHFTVVLMYKPELIMAERERKGLDYTVKVEELEVAK